ncbi:MAG: acetyl-transferase [Dehalococcoidia bacterium]|nr:acetyl-transferase [Dehalococcoidia bacterium]
MHMANVREEPTTLASLLEHGNVSISFLVESRYRVESVRNGLGGWGLTEEPVEHPYIKDYDERDGEGPRHWASRFDISNWGILSAFEGQERIGGAVISFNTPGVYMLEGRTDLAVLWDIRVHPEYRHQGIGALLFARVIEWANAHRCTTLKVETQNINVPACKFYARMGCQLRAIHPDAYPDLPDEVQLLWYRPL